MAERIVSPGVFTNENDLSFLPQGIGEIGAAIIGPTEKGPAFWPTQVTSNNDFDNIFGGDWEDSYVPYTIRNYLNNAGVITVVRILGLTGYSGNVGVLYISGSDIAGTGLGSAAAAWTAVGLLHHSWADTEQDFVALATYNDGTGVKGPSNGIGANASASQFLLEPSASLSKVTCSLNSSNKQYTPLVFGTGPKKGTVDSSGDVSVATDPQDRAYTYTIFKDFAASVISTNSTASVSGSYITLDLSGSTYGVYRGAVTPWIKSQDVAGTKSNLFRVHSLSDGTDTNIQYKIAISNVKFASEIAKSDYGNFTLTVRKVDDTDKVTQVIETYSNLSLDPNATNYIGRKIGDKYYKLNSDGKLKVYGDWTNISKFIRIEVDDNVKYRSYDGALIPLGFAAIYQPLTGSITLPSASMVTEQVVSDEYNSKVYYGFNFTNIFDGADNYYYLKPFPNGADAGNNAAFDLGSYSSHPSASTPNTSLSSSDSPLNARKFIVPMTNGFNGYDPARVVKKGKDISSTNSFGYDVSTTNADGYLAYKRGLDALANQDLYDFNMLLLPGIIRSQHSALTQAAMDLCETRGDAFYVMDSDLQEATIATCQSTVSSIDTSYAATYYPWVKILDTNVNLPVWVPPSVVLGGVIAYNDKVSYEWFAPAGLNRGGLTEVLDAYDRVTQSDRDDLYDSNINPIASFPNTGFVVWGQKTLQVKSSALDRINVRRLLIAAKKFIASATKYLVFEQNTSATRNRFLNIANPYLDSVQQRQGLYAFKVVMDETNNTPEVIDRNQMVGAIYLQPTKTAEFIVLDFNILPTGATFPGD